MNLIKAVVTKIETIDNLSIVSFHANNHDLRMMALGLNLPIKIGTPVTLGAKASNISLAKNLSGFISLSNQLQCTIISLNKGELLCSVLLGFFDTTLECIITLQSAIKMNLQVGDNVTALIKASELSILETES